MNSTPNITTLQIRLTPNAKKSGVNGLWNNTHWRISVQAPAVDGKANEALILFLSKELNVPKSFIQIVAGHTSRLKTLQIKGCPPILWKK